MKLRMRRESFSWFRAFLVIGIIAVFCFGSSMIRNLIYFPEKTITQSEQELLKTQGFVSWVDNENSDEFRGYIRQHAKPEKIIVFFHGIAGNAAHRIYMTKGFLNSSSVLLLAEYPGYGERKGRPTEDALYETALKDIKILENENPEVPLYLVGESLGTGVATWLATQVKIQGLVLVSPFTSLIDVGKIHYPILPVKTLLADRYESMENLSDVAEHRAVPLLVIHGTADEIVPFKLGKELYNSYTGSKKLIPLEGYNHNNLPWDDLDGALWKGVWDWIDS